MYTTFLKGLAEIAEHLDKAVQVGGQLGDGMPTPYLFGKVEVRLDGERVGYFEIEDDWVVYHEDEKR